MPRNKKEVFTDYEEVKELAKPTICLTMIVKNESKTIKKCIDSVKDYIDYWVIVDTGSTDGTQDLIKKIMGDYGIQGELHERPWVDFGKNRTESLEYAKGKADYRLVIDADDVLVVDEGVNPFLGLDKDFYKVKIKLGSIVYYRTQLVRGDQNWKYVGVLHEYITSTDTDLSEAFLEGAEMHASVSGDTREIKGRDKYYNDAIIFEKALLTTPKEELDIDLERRYVFYMAQSYRDCGNIERSIESYERRVSLGGWEEEIYISLYWIARQKHMRGDDEAEIINSYLKAWEYRPIRLEALYQLVKYLGQNKRYAFAFALTSIGMKVAPCSDLLFVEQDVWKWRMPDEYAVLAYYNGNVEEAIRTNKLLIESPFFNDIPEQEKHRIIRNLEIYTQSLSAN